MHYYTRFKNHEHSYQVWDQAQLCVLIISNVKNEMPVMVSSNPKLAPACDHVPARLAYKSLIWWQRLRLPVSSTLAACCDVLDAKCCITGAETSYYMLIQHFLSAVHPNDMSE